MEAGVAGGEGGGGGGGGYYREGPPQQSPFVGDYLVGEPPPDVDIESSSWIDKVSLQAWALIQEWGWMCVAMIVIGVYSYRYLEGKYRAMTAPPLVHKSEEARSDRERELAQALQRSRERQQQMLEEANAARVQAQSQPCCSRGDASESDSRTKSGASTNSTTTRSRPTRREYNPLDGGGGAGGGFKKSNPIRSRG